MTGSKCSMFSHIMYLTYTVCKRGCSAGKILSSETKVCCNFFRQGHRARTCQAGHCRSCTKKHYTLIHKSMMRMHPYNTVRHEQVQVHQMSHLYRHYKRTRCQRSITQMQLLTREYIAGQFYNMGLVNIPGMRIKRKFIPVKGINNVVSDNRHSANIQLCTRNSDKRNVLYLTQD
jgi:hypothetical protein